MQQGIKLEEFNKKMKNLLNSNLQKIVNHINTHNFVKAELLNDEIKILFLEDVTLTSSQKENILELFKKGGIIKKKSESKDNKDDFFFIKKMME